MKIAVCSTGPNLDSQISPVFGRCPYFLIVDSETMEFKAILNPASQSGRGAGVGASQIIASEGAGAVICGNLGPNAFSILKMSGIKIYSGIFGLTVKEGIDRYRKGELREAEAPIPPGRFGFGWGRGFGRGFGPGPRRRRRRGQ